MGEAGCLSLPCSNHIDREPNSQHTAALGKAAVLLGCFVQHRLCLGRKYNSQGLECILLVCWQRKVQFSSFGFIYF